MFTRKTTLKSKIKKQRMMMSLFFLIFVAISSLIAVSQLDVIREFASQASGEPANIKIDTKAIIGPLPRPWRNLAQGGESHDWRLQPISGQVKALNPEYIRIDHVYTFHDIVKGGPGNLSFDFSKLDLLIDDILATGAKPYISLSYMPPAISSGDIISPPVNWFDWQLTVQKTIEHISGTKGIGDVYYEVWNEPDLFGNWKYYGDKNYLSMYTYASKGAQNAKGVKPFKIGGPGITALYKNWFNALAQHALNNNLRYDFFSWHRYNHDITQFNEDMQLATAWLDNFPQLEPTLELHITEWGHDSENHAGYDNNYSAAHTVAASIEMINVVDRAFVFEIQDGKDPAGKEYWGRWGIITAPSHNAKPKPRYFGLKMLDRLQEMRLQTTGKGYWVKAQATLNEKGDTQLIMANFDRFGRNTENVPVLFENIEPGNYTISKEYLNGQRNLIQTATDSAVLQTIVPMSPNSVVFVELVKQPN
jgi:hypothetical protein